MLFDCTYHTDAVRWVVSRDASERAFADWHSAWRRTCATASLQRLFAAMFAQNLFAAHPHAFGSSLAALPAPASASPPTIACGDVSLQRVAPSLVGAQLTRRSKRRDNNSSSSNSKGGAATASATSAQQREAPYIPLIKRKREQSYEENVSALKGKRLVRHMVVNVKSLQYREYNEHRSKVLSVPSSAAGAASVTVGSQPTASASATNTTTAAAAASAAPPSAPSNAAAASAPSS